MKFRPCNQQFTREQAQTNNLVNLRMAQAISLLPMKLRNPVQTLIRSLQELSPADLK